MLVLHLLNEFPFCNAKIIFFLNSCYLIEYVFGFQDVIENIAIAKRIKFINRKGIYLF